MSESIERFLGLVKQPDELIEIRTDTAASERRVRYHGYYNNHRKAAEDAADWSGNVYFTINQLEPTIKPTNELIRCKKGACTKASDIVRRTLLYLDCDPVRPSGTPSTDEQHQQAIDLVKFVAKQVPFPSPLIGDSGNGACAFWKIDLPPESNLVTQVLKTIKAKWQTPNVSIDLSVASLARIGRLLGTWNYKGGKRGRQSKIVEAPDQLQLVPSKQLSVFALIPQDHADTTRVQQLVTSWTFGKSYQDQIANVRVLLQSKQIQFTQAESPDHNNTLCYWFHFDCVFRPGQNDAQNWIKVHPTEGVSAGCHHSKCRGKGLADLLSITAPEIAAQAAEAYDDSHRLARSYLQSRSRLVIWQANPYSYQDGCYKEEPEAAVKAELNLSIKKEFDQLGFNKTPNVTTKVVYNAYAAVAAQTYNRNENAPHWLRNAKHDASEYLAFNNGLLYVPSYLNGAQRDVIPHTPDLFSLAKLPYDFLPDAPEPKLFKQFCAYQWADEKAHLLLEEILGDVLLADPRMRVFYVFTGKGGAGKSALAEIIEGLTGERNRCAVNLHDFASTFGLEGAVGKKLILVSEAGVDSRYSSAIVEKIKQITGNDLISVNRKNKPILSTRLDAKILAVSNHLLHLIDESGALFDRLIPVPFTRRIENPDKQWPLKVKKDELPGIVLLALKGWKRLRENGHFTMPDSSESILNELREKGSPVLSFVEERCKLDPATFTPTDTLFDSWKNFCNEREFNSGLVGNFVDALRSACPEIRKDRRTIGKDKQRGFAGIGVVQ